MARARRATLDRKRKFVFDEDSELEALNSDSDYVAGSDADDDFAPTHRKAKKAKVLPKPPSKATVVILAETDIGSTQRLENVDQMTLERIKKALNLSKHPGTTEIEARQALRLAMKMMEKLNISQAQVLENMDEKEDMLKQAGQSVVSVCCQEGKSMYISAWASTASSAVSDMFDVKCFTELGEQSNQVKYTFYGLGPNTASAAVGFETVYNLIMAWRMANKEAKGINAKNAYCRGVADGFYSFSQREKRREEKQAREAEVRRLEAQRKAEEEQRQKEIERLELENIEIKPKFDIKVKIEDEEEEKIVRSTPAPGPSYSPLADDDSDEDAGYNDGDYGDNVSDEGSHLWEGLDTEEAQAEDAVAPDFQVKGETRDLDLDELLKKSDERARDPTWTKDLKKRDNHRVKEEVQDVKIPKAEMNEALPKAEEMEETSWQSAGALIAFRHTSLLLADDYLKKKGLKLRSRGKRAEIKFKDQNAVQSYDKGWEDAKKIDLKRKRIKASTDD
ncbi:hypothetical protein J3R30DRAFT_3473915 [Lentinula aciculospora]|uniref:DUF2786 domain-containing protein n=1 Tax=Lentinula aciculospora TaxID=153920 RepID=A0A9W9DNI0_9AGAR|nr:hypothetical protein J3R30DRAFT_3473915 [Lentinula aciculospora]